MGIGIRRPLCCFCWLFILTTALCLRDTLRPYAWIVALAAALLALLLLALGVVKRRRIKALFASFLCLSVLLASGAMLLRERALQRSVEVYAEQTEIIHGTVLTREYGSNYRTGFTVHIDRIGEQSCSQKAYLACEFLSSLQIGDRFTAQVLLQDLREVDEEPTIKRARLSDGCRFLATMVSAQDCLSITSDGRGTRLLPSIRLAAAVLQQRLSLEITERVDGQAGALSAALLLGDKSQLDGLTTLDFRRSGASHLLALSGLHLSIIVGLFSWLLLKTRVPYGVRIALVSLFAVFYLFLTGCSVSTLRATVMLLYLNLAHRCGRPSDSLTSLSLFFAGCIAVEPYMLYDAALWLSSLAAFVLVGVIPSLGEKAEQKKPRTLSHRVLTSLGASLLIMAVLIVPMWLIFGEIALLSPLSTLLLTPLTALLLILGLLLLPLSLLGGWVVAEFWCGWIAHAMQAIATLMLRLTANFSDLGDTVVSLRFDFCRWLLPLFAVVFAVFLLIKVKRKRLLGVIPCTFLLAFCLLYGTALGRGDDMLMTEHAAKGNSELLLLTHGSTAVLCDISDGSYSAYSLLLADGISKQHTELDAVVLTHYHNKHISSMEKLFAATKVRTLYLPLTMPYCEQGKAVSDEGIARVLVEIAGENRVNVEFFSPEETVAFDRICLRALHYEMIDRSEHPALALSWYCIPKGSEQPRCVTYFGASTHETEQIALRFDDMLRQSQAVILGGHGPLIKQPLVITAWSEELQYLLISKTEVAAALTYNAETAAALDGATLIVAADEPSILLIRAAHQEEDRE